MGDLELFIPEAEIDLLQMKLVSGWYTACTAVDQPRRQSTDDVRCT